MKTDATVAFDQASAQAAIDLYTGITTGALFLFSDGTDAHLWFDSNPSLAGGAVAIAALVSVDLAELGNLNAADVRFI